MLAHSSFQLEGDKDMGNSGGPLAIVNEDQALLDQLINLLNIPGLDGFDQNATGNGRAHYPAFTGSLYADAAQESQDEMDQSFAQSYNKNLAGGPVAATETNKRYSSDEVEIVFGHNVVISGEGTPKQLSAAEMDAVITKAGGKSPSDVVNKNYSAVDVNRIVNGIRLRKDSPGTAPKDFTPSTLDKILKEVTSAREKAAEAAAHADIAKLKAARADEIKRYQEGVAKALPALATGIRDAVRGFQSGDPMAGSAAIMDICSTIASIGGSLSLAGGPPGAIVGALFSVVSMILKMFVKEQKSLTTQLQEMLEVMQSRQKLADLKVAQKAIDAFVETLMPKPPQTLDLVRNKWTHNDLKAMLNPIEGDTIVKIRAVSVWLEEEETQQLPLWGEILATQCQVYINYMYALTVAITSLDVSAMPDGGKIVKEKLTRAFTSNDPEQLAFLRRVKPLAQRRGIVWSIGYQNLGQKADCGPLLVRDTTTGAWTNLGHEQRVVAVAKRKTAKAEDAHPFFAIFSLERSDSQLRRSPGHAFRNQENKKMFFMEGRWPLASRSKWQPVDGVPTAYDIAATPGEKDLEVYLYLADGNQVARYSNQGGPTLQDRIFLFPYEKGYTCDSLAVAPRPLAAEGDDPNALKDEKAAVYGAGNDRFQKRYIKACFANGFKALPAPPDLANANDFLEFTGIAADRKRLWVFSREVIACVTHTDARRYVLELGRNPLGAATMRPPDWAVYKILEEFGGAWQDHDAFSGLHDIAPSEDGTLLAVFRTKKATEPRIYFSTPTFDHKGGKLIIKGVGVEKSGKKFETPGWTLFDSDDKQGHSNRIYKQPIYCWPLLDRFMTLLEDPATTPALQPGRQPYPNLVIPPIPVPNPVPRCPD
jgi:hypothetical protein